MWYSFFSPRPGSSPHLMGTWLKNNNTCFQMHCSCFSLSRSSTSRCVGFILMTQTAGTKTSARDHLIPFHPQIHVQPGVTARVGVALPGGCGSLLQSDWWRRVLHLWQFFPLTRTRIHTHTLRSRSLRRARGYIRLHGGFIWQLHFPNHVSKNRRFSRR